MSWMNRPSPQFVAIPSDARSLSLLLRNGVVPRAAVDGVIIKGAWTGESIAHLDVTCLHARRQLDGAALLTRSRLATARPFGSRLYLCDCKAQGPLSAWIADRRRVAVTLAALEYAESSVAGLDAPDDDCAFENRARLLGVLRLTWAALTSPGVDANLASTFDAPARGRASARRAVTTLEVVHFERLATLIEDLAARTRPEDARNYQAPGDPSGPAAGLTDEAEAALELDPEADTELEPEDGTWYRWILAPNPLDFDSTSPLGWAGNFATAIGMFGEHEVLAHSRRTANGQRQLVLHAPGWALRYSGGDVTCLGEMAEHATEPAWATFAIYDRAVKVRDAIRREHPGLSEHELMAIAAKVAAPAA